MKKHFQVIFVTVIFFFSLKTLATNTLFSAGAREAGLANSSVSIGGIWSVYSNPGAMTSNAISAFGLSYQNLYQLKELSTMSIAGIVPGKYGALGASLSYFGTSSYNEQKYAVGYAHKLGEKISAGILFDYFSSNLPDVYETSHTLAGELGVFVSPVKKLNLGVHVFNVSGANYNLYYQESLPILYRIGATWNDDLFLISSQVQLDNRGNALLSFGSEILLVKNLFIRAGIMSNSKVNYSFGLGYGIGRLVCDVAFTHHPVLGFSSCISVQYNFARLLQ